VRAKRKELGVVPSMKRVDTCAAEFEAVTPYMYSSYEGDCECESTTNKKVLILGGGPNRIGQGIEFDYCCCHASFALRSAISRQSLPPSTPGALSLRHPKSLKTLY
jgi:carbamoyl-phosphate synthase large subunit